MEDSAEKYGGIARLEGTKIIHKFGNVQLGGTFTSGQGEYVRIPESSLGSPSGARREGQRFNAVLKNGTGTLMVYFAEDSDIDHIEAYDSRIDQLPTSILIDQLKAIIIEREQEVLECAEQDNTEQASDLEDEIEELRGILERLKADDWTGAWRLTRTMDTFYRQSIPLELYEELRTRA